LIFITGKSSGIAQVALNIVALSSKSLPFKYSVLPVCAFVTPTNTFPGYFLYVSISNGIRLFGISSKTKSSPNILLHLKKFL